MKNTIASAKPRSLWLLFPLFCFISHKNIVQAQELDLGTWNIYNMQMDLSNRWSGFFEAQLRSLLIYKNFHYYEAKGGIIYEYRDGLFLALAGGRYDTYQEGGNFRRPANQLEWRLWPQALFRQKIGQLMWEHRYRMEMRFTNNGYRNRFRYRLGVNYRFGEKIDEEKANQLFINNEIFFTNTAPYFERNRITLGYSRRISGNVSLLLGYVHQYDYKITDEIGRDFLQVGIYFELQKGSHTRQGMD